MERVRVGVIGAGLIAQVEHVPNLLRLKHLFELVGICDPSAMARTAMTKRHGLAAFETPEQLLGQKLDALLITSPDPLHKEHVLAGLKHGLHVFCEKPLCYGTGDITELIAARDAAGRVLQVGYMKRFDPSYEAAIAHMPGTAANLRHVSVEVSDPDAWPFVRHHDYVRSDDIAPALITAVDGKRRDQVKKAVGRVLEGESYRGFCGPYASSLVHDVNAVHGLLDALNVPDGEVAGAQIFANGEGGQGSVRLLGGQALWTMSHLAVPKLPDYRERITLYFDDASLELEFPSPYLNHQATRLTIKTGDDHVLERRNIHAGFAEAFLEELKGFWSAIREGSPVRNTAEHAARDMALLTGLARWQADHATTSRTQGAAA